MVGTGFRYALAVAAASAFLACAGGALAASGGGIGIGGPGPGGGDGTQASDSSWKRVPFGARALSRGHRGSDVKTLNWLLRSRAFGVPYGGGFFGKTDVAVRRFQRSAGVRATGVVRKRTRWALARQMARQGATWYDLSGRRTACGQRLTKRTIGVAHRRLPCGTRVIVAYRGRWIRARVIDRGPYTRGNAWDLTWQAAKRLRFLAVGRDLVRVAVARR